MSSSVEVCSKNAISDDLQRLREEFDILVALHRRKLLKLASKYCLSADLAEDAVQAGLLKAWTALPKFRRDSKLSTWLTIIVVNEALQILRRRKRALMVEITEEYEIPVPDILSEHHLSPEALMLLQERNAQLERALQLLPKPLQNILTLNIIYEIPAREIAGMLEITTASAKTKIFRSRRELKRRWASQQALRRAS